MTTPASALDIDSSPEVSPRRSWRTDSSRPTDPPVPELGRTRSSSRRSRRPVTSTQPRPRRGPTDAGTPPSRPADARGRSAPPIPARDRSPLDTERRPTASQAPSRQPSATRDLGRITRTIHQVPASSRASSPHRTRAPPTQCLGPQAPSGPASSPRRSRAAAPQPLRPVPAPVPLAPLPQPGISAPETRSLLRSPSPQPGTSTGLRGTPFQPSLLRGSSESTLTAPTPPRATRRPRSPSPPVQFMGPPPSRRQRSPATVTQRSRPTETLMRTPPRLSPEAFEVPRTPGHFSSPEVDTGLDLTRLHRSLAPDTDSVEDDPEWDRFSTSTVPAPVPPAQLPSADTPLSWIHIVDLVYQSGLLDASALPASPEPVRSVIGGPQQAAKKKVALPPSPLAAASLPSAMRSCWGGNWSSHAQHQPPPPNAALHPGPSTWVPEFRTRFHAGPGMDLRPARLSAREREWAGSAQPPVEHSWLLDIETMARAQLAALSNLEWLFGVYLDSSPRASPVELETVRGFIVRELQHAVNFSGAQIAASTLGRRRAILDPLHNQLSQTTRNWLQLQPVELRTHQGLFGPASALVPDIMRQQPVPRANPPNRRRAGRPQHQQRREPTREPPAPRAPAQTARAPAATYTPTAAAAPAPPRAQNRPRGRGGQQPSARGARGAKQLT